MPFVFPGQQQQQQPSVLLARISYEEVRADDNGARSWEQRNKEFMKALFSRSNTVIALDVYWLINIYLILSILPTTNYTTTSYNMSLNIWTLTQAPSINHTFGVQRHPAKVNNIRPPQDLASYIAPQEMITSHQSKRRT